MRIKNRETSAFFGGRLAILKFFVFSGAYAREAFMLQISGVSTDSSLPESRERSMAFMMKTEEIMSR